jgi:hypothetical protein
MALMSVDHGTGGVAELPLRIFDVDSAGASKVELDLESTDADLVQLAADEACEGEFRRNAVHDPSSVPAWDPARFRWPRPRQEARGASSNSHGIGRRYVVLSAGWLRPTRPSYGRSDPAALRGFPFRAAKTIIGEGSDA